MKIVNLMGHELTMDTGGEVVRFPGINDKAWVDTDVVDEDWVEVVSYQFDDTDMKMKRVSVPILSLRENGIKGLPQRDPDCLYVVSGIVAAKAGRRDVVSPGRVTGVGSERKARCLIRHVQ